MPRITGIAPEFHVADIVKAAERYRDRLGFAILAIFFENPPVLAMVARDQGHHALEGRARPWRSNRAFKREAIDAYL